MCGDHDLQSQRGADCTVEGCADTLLMGSPITKQRSTGSSLTTCSCETAGGVFLPSYRIIVVIFISSNAKRGWFSVEGAVRWPVVPARTEGQIFLATSGVTRRGTLVPCWGLTLAQKPSHHLRNWPVGRLRARARHSTEPTVVLGMFEDWGVCRRQASEVIARTCSKMCMSSCSNGSNPLSQKSSHVFVKYAWWYSTSKGRSINENNFGVCSLHLIQFSQCIVNRVWVVMMCDGDRFELAQTMATVHSLFMDKRVKSAIYKDGVVSVKSRPR